ncbi:glycosyltransferase family 2 protein [Candidatus Omnitrophota bacterium]
MRLIIQIPCYNEENTLSTTLKDLPTRIDGIDSIETLIVDDGSSDDTIKVAKAHGVNHIVSFPTHRGLAEAFKKGLEKALEEGADIIVNTDGDNQYSGDDIPKLVKPIINRRADIVVGCRDIFAIKHFSVIKKILQSIGSRIVRRFSNTDIPDTTSGFRAYSRDAALQMNVFSTYTYTIETIIQAGRKEIPMTHVDIKTNEKLRESRLMKNIFSYILRSVSTILRIYLMYEPFKSFVRIGLIPIFLSLILFGRFFIHHFTRSYGGHVQSLIIAAIGIIIGGVIIMIGLLGDVISANRKLNEEVLYRLKKDSLKKR